MQTVSCSMWELVTWPGVKPGLPALGVWSLRHWTRKSLASLQKGRDTESPQREDGHVNTEEEMQDSATRQHPPEATRDQDGASPTGVRGSRALLTPRLQATGLQNSETTDICCLKPPCLQYLLQQPWETKTDFNWLLILKFANKS